MYKLQIAILMYRVHHQLHPLVLLNLFERVKHDKTRQKRHFNDPHATTTSYEKSVAIQGPKLYNLLLNKVKLNSSLASYKKHVSIFLESQGEI